MLSDFSYVYWLFGQLFCDMPGEIHFYIKKIIFNAFD